VSWSRFKLEAKRRAFRIYGVETNYKKQIQKELGAKARGQCS